MKKVLKIAGLTLAGFVVLMVVIAFFGSIGMGEIKKLTFTELNLTTTADGVYKGSYHKGRWNYDVEVTVADHRITGIVNTNKSMEPTKGLTRKAAEKIIAGQSLKIDAVSGSSVNTKALCKAVEIALTKGEAR